MDKYGEKLLDEVEFHSFTEPEKALNEKIHARNEPVRALHYILVFFVGVLNNCGYVLVNSAAQSIAKSFDKEDLIALIPWLNIAMGSTARSVNAFFLLKISHTSRILFIAVLMLLGYLGVAVATFVSFYFALAAILLVGSASSFGESVNLGFLRAFPSELVGAWSSGTGMAGVLGSGLYLILSSANLQDSLIFFVASPFAVVYCSIYLYLYRSSKSNRKVYAEEEQRALRQSMTISMSNLDPKTESTLTRVLRCEGYIWTRALQLSAVYFLEYVVSVAFADAVNPKVDEGSFFRVHAYVILSFCYQLGVLLSRSSLKLVKIQRVEVITSLQAVNFIFWFLLAIWKFAPLWVQFLLMVFVGLLGGASYVNTMYLIMNDRRIPEKDREFSLNLCALHIDFGIFSACAFMLLFTKVIYPAING
eukprot:GILK01006606.1.p1 GENE.GILK01006606.1~~GILK01006606.1.p1  ORF type:complete len:460 (+),score=74.39 GILK01006606.1:123-1382(+)